MLKRKVLVVDDEKDIVKCLSMRLEKSEYEVLTAHDGFQATKKAMSENPDLIILDIGMPSGNGHEVVRCLRAEESTCRIPIIFLTAHTSEEDYRKAVESGVERYITKPFRAESLMAAVEELMNKTPVGPKREKH
jgi:two-component system alkaline phosphatase synthesis response regulator PhoP